MNQSEKSAVRAGGVTRRQWVAGAGAGALALGGLAAAPARSANNIVRVGVIGAGVRGKHLIGNLPESARVVALCDCAQLRLESTLQPAPAFAGVLEQFHKRDARRCAVHQDYRRMLDREQLDAVVIATPDHHHAPAALRALQAGLHVYLEKPLTVCIREGRLLADAVRRTGRVLQVGSQQRTMEMNRFACAFIRQGGLGKVGKVELPCYPGPLRHGAFPAEPPTEGLDWELFCGPAPLQPQHRRLWMKEDFKVDGLLWRGWDLFRDYSGHLMTNWGAHSVDMVQLALGRDDTGPVEIRPREPKSASALWSHWTAKTPPPSPREGASTADDRRFWPVEMRYADGVELHFVHGPDFIVFYGERGVLRMRRNYFETDPPDLIQNRPPRAEAEKWQGTGHVARPHLENWLDAIRTGAAVNAPVDAGQRTATICHLANLARELNRPLRWNPQEERFVNDAEADSLLDRSRRKGFELPTP